MDGDADINLVKKELVAFVAGEGSDYEDDNLQDDQLFQAIN